MIILQSADRFNDLARLDTDTGEITWFSRCVDIQDTSFLICGHISNLQGHISCLYRKTGLLYFRIDEQIFELTDEVYTEHSYTQDNLRRFVISHGSVQLFDWIYKVPTISPALEFDPTPFVEEEHFDFCLFVHNIMIDPERRKRIYAKCV